jgi:hypothetical protein
MDVTRRNAPAARPGLFHGRGTLDFGPGADYAGGEKK